MKELTTNKKMYALVGNWHYIPGPRGYTVYEYEPQTAALKFVEHICEHVAAGQQALDAKRGIVYVVDEAGDKRGKCGGGGHVLAFRINADDGHLAFLGEKETLSPAPSYISIDKTGKYAIVVHHTGFSHVTRAIKHTDGTFSSETLFDDAAVDLFRINDDGTLGEICDMDIHRGEGDSGPHMMSHLHCVVADPTGNLFLVCDKGLDRIWSYTIDREKGELRLLSETAVGTGNWPRYGAFHPQINAFYVNHEKTPDINAYHYDIVSGKLELFQTVSMGRGTEDQPTEASDILVGPGGKFLYVTDRGSNTIAIFKIQSSGELELLQCVDCGGKNPRGLCVAPDGRFMLVANSDSAAITVFKILDNGMLEFYKNNKDEYCPANICIAVL